MSMSVSTSVISRSMVLQSRKLHVPQSDTKPRVIETAHAVSTTTPVDAWLRTQLFVTTVANKVQSLTDDSIVPPYTTQDGRQKFNTKNILDAAAKEIYAELQTETTAITFATRQKHILALFELLKGYDALQSSITKKSEKGDLTKGERLANKFRLPDGGYARYFGETSLFKSEEIGTAPHVQYAFATLNFIYDNLKNPTDKQRLADLKNQFYPDMAQTLSFQINMPLVPLCTTVKSASSHSFEDHHDYRYDPIYHADFQGYDESVLFVDPLESPETEATLKYEQPLFLPELPVQNHVSPRQDLWQSAEAHPYYIDTLYEDSSLFDSDTVVDPYVVPYGDSSEFRTRPFGLGKTPHEQVASEIKRRLHVKADSRFSTVRPQKVFGM